MKVNVYIVTHKDFTPPENKNYIPIAVGNKVRMNFIKDSTGNNISYKNKSFCELTAMYCIWKNLMEESNVTGMVHYRRYFINSRGILQCDDIQRIMEEYDIIIPKPRNYYITSIEKHYKASHYGKDLTIVREIIYNGHPDYIDAFEYIMRGRKLSLFNMFIAKNEVLESYFEWLFPILFDMEKKVNTNGYDAYQSRVIGFMAERLFNVWIYKNQEIKVKYCRVKNTEGEQKVKKIMPFLNKVIKGVFSD